MPSFTLSNVASVIFPQNALRKSFIILNEDATIAIYLKEETNSANLTVSATDHDFRLNPGESVSFNQDDGNRCRTARWTGIAASGTPRISFHETEDKLR